MKVDLTFLESNQRFNLSFGEIHIVSGADEEPTVVTEKDVNFYDYDGTLLYSYTLDEIQELTELPQLPERDGLICQGWNWTLVDLQEYGKSMNVGANYITDDGKTRLYIHLPVDTHLNVPICFSQSRANGVTIDWGDGSPIETNGTTWGCTVTHSYASVGDYVITLTVTNGTLDLGYGYHFYSIVGGSSNADGETKNQYYKNTLTKIEIGNGVSIINNRAFYNCMKLKKITMPQGVTLSGGDNFHMCPSLEFIVCKTASSAKGSVFYDCGSLRRISFNKDTYIGDNFFAYCYTLDKVRIHHAPNGTGFGGGAFFDCGGVKSEVEIPETQTQIYDGMFRKNRGIPKFTFPPSITSIGASAFADCFGTVLYDFTKHSTVPTLANTNAFTGITSDCIILVPDSLVTQWKTATNWSTYASYIKGASEV